MTAQPFSDGNSPIANWLAAPPHPAGVAQRGYAICATPRSGSYFLCDLLRSTGVLGRPHEYFGGDVMRRLGAPNYPHDLPSQIAATRTLGCTANGIFGVKLFPAQLAGRSAGAIMAGLDNPLLVLLEREDLLGQAISLSRAAQTHRFFAGAEPSAVPCFDAPLIRDYLELLVCWNATWHIYFARRGVIPLRLSYEQVVAEPQSAVTRIAEALGLAETPAIEPGLLSMSVQRDAMSEEWRKRFLADQLELLELTELRSTSTISATVLSHT